MTAKCWNTHNAVWEAESEARHRYQLLKAKSWSHCLLWLLGLRQWLWAAAVWLAYIWIRQIHVCQDDSVFEKATVYACFFKLSLFFKLLHNVYLSFCTNTMLAMQCKYVFPGDTHGWILEMGLPGTGLGVWDPWGVLILPVWKSQKSVKTCKIQNGGKKHYKSGTKWPKETKLIKQNKK